jgi:ABC-type transporter Mla subunit MlaD
MPEHALAHALAALHAELARHPDLDDDDRARLQVALDEIQRALSARAPHPPEAVQRLESAALGFEDRHPTLTHLVEQLADAVRRAGI